MQMNERKLSLGTDCGVGAFTACCCNCWIKISNYKIISNTTSGKV